MRENSSGAMEYITVKFVSLTLWLPTVVTMRNGKMKELPADFTELERGLKRDGVPYLIKEHKGKKALFVPADRFPEAE